MGAITPAQVPQLSPADMASTEQTHPYPQDSGVQDRGKISESICVSVVISGGLEERVRTGDHTLNREIVWFRLRVLARGVWHVIS